jgi:hypothetical protein
MPNTLAFPDAGSFTLDPDRSDAHARADGTHVARVRGGHVLARVADGAIWAQVAAADVPLADNATTFVEISAAGTIVSNQRGFTAGAQQLYAITVAAGNITAIADWRFR